MTSKKNTNPYALFSIEANTLSKEQIEELLPQLDNLINWINSLKEYALGQALNGVQYKGYKLVEGRSNRRYTDEDKIANVLIGDGYKEEEIYTKKLLTITNLEKLIGARKVGTLLGDLIIKPRGKPTLVDAEDKRNPYNPEVSAVADFGDY